MNRLFFGDNLNVLREHTPDESVDLVYLDPPFKSDADYNVLFKTRDGQDSPAQIQAFTDTWRWDEAAAAAFEEAAHGDGVGYCDLRVSRTLEGFLGMIGQCDMLAYLAYMAPRLMELRRVMKPTASIYLHCDPTASHYLKLLMDAVFGPENYRSELVWKRTSTHSGARRWGPVHDTLLFYSRSAAYTWNPQFQPYDASYVSARFSRTDKRGRNWKDADLTGAGLREGDSGAPWRGFNPTDKGRHWAVSVDAVASAIDDLKAEGVDVSRLSTQDKLDILDAADRIYWPTKEGGWPRLKQHLEDLPGVAVQDVVTDIPPLNSQAAERLGYPTQKPVALLDRIIRSSSREGDVILDPFCGCGTAVDAAQRLGRSWVGIDITHLAIGIIKSRMADTYGESVRYKVLGVPTDLAGARELANLDRHEFEYWALDLVRAVPGSGARKKGADRGVDGRLIFRDDERGRTKQAIVSVKSGRNVSVRDVRDLRGTVERERAELGVLLTLEEPTREMRKEAASSGHYRSPFQTTHPRIQILTIAEVLAGAAVNMPRPGTKETYRRAPAARRVAKTGDLFGEGR